jgi:hypothetical protein
LFEPSLASPPLASPNAGRPESHARWHAAFGRPAPAHLSAAKLTNVEIAQARNLGVEFLARHLLFRCLAYRLQADRITVNESEANRVRIISSLAASTC